MITPNKDAAAAELIHRPEQIYLSPAAFDADVPFADLASARAAWQTSPEAAYREAQRRIALARREELPSLYLGGLNALEAIPPEVDGLSHVVAIAISGAEQETASDASWRLSDISALANMSALRFLELPLTQTPLDMTPLAQLRELAHISGGVWCDLSPLVGLTALRRAYLHDCRQLADISPLAELRQLEVLQMGDLAAMDLSPIAKLDALSELDLVRCRARDFSMLGQCQQLKHLTLHDCRAADWNFLSRMTGLEQLHLTDSNFANLSLLTPLQKLELLDLTGAQTTSLDALEDVVALSEIHLSYEPELDVSLFLRAPHLEHAVLYDISSDEQDDLAFHRSDFETLKIIHPDTSAPFPAGRLPDYRRAHPYSHTIWN